MENWWRNKDSEHRTAHPTFSLLRNFLPVLPIPIYKIIFHVLGLLPRLKGSSGLKMGPGLRRGPGLGSMGNLWEEGLASLRKHATFFQAEVYAILACVHETETQDRPEKCVIVCSDCQAALKALQAAKTTSPLVWQCQKALNDISTWHTVGLYWVPGHAGIRGNEITDKLARDGPLQRFAGTEPFLGSLGRT